MPDWSGGTRLGKKTFMERSGQGGSGAGSSHSGLQRRLEAASRHCSAEQMRRLRGVARRLVWVNPHRGKVGLRSGPARE